MDKEKYYFISEDGIQEQREVEVRECILKGVFTDNGEETEIVMDKERFDEWRIKMKEEVKDE